MAVVFISPKHRQKMFFIGITLMFLLFLTMIALGVLLSKPKEVPPTVVFNQSKIDVNMSIFDSTQFKDLDAFPAVMPQYSYKATAKGNGVKMGFISAPSVDKARAILEAMGLTVSNIAEVAAGREDPFIPYYQVDSLISKTE